MQKEARGPHKFYCMPPRFDYNERRKQATHSRGRAPSPGPFAGVPCRTVRTLDNFRVPIKLADGIEAEIDVGVVSA